MTVIGEFRYVNHYFKIYEDGEIYVDYKPLGNNKCTYGGKL